jgi:O-antigen/teichoic acid export membrane protein
MFLGQKGLSYLRRSQPVTRGWTIAALFVALIALSLLKRVPLIGSWIGFFALIAGVGGLVRYIWSQRDARGTVSA